MDLIESILSLQSRVGWCCTDSSPLRPWISSLVFAKLLWVVWRKKNQSARLPLMLAFPNWCNAFVTWTPFSCAARTLIRPRYSSENRFLDQYREPLKIIGILVWRFSPHYSILKQNYRAQNTILWIADSKTKLNINQWLCLNRFICTDEKDMWYIYCRIKSRLQIWREIHSKLHKWKNKSGPENKKERPNMSDSVKYVLQTSYSSPDRISISRKWKFDAWFSQKHVKCLIFNSSLTWFHLRKLTKALSQRIDGSRNICY